MMQCLRVIGRHIRRWPDPRRGKGTRSGLRIIYYYFREHAQIWLMTLYGKDELKDLTAAQKRTLKAAIDAERRARTARRPPGGKTR
jgi:hypothetical protein